MSNGTPKAWSDRAAKQETVYGMPREQWDRYGEQPGLMARTEHYAVNLAYCNCGSRLIDDHVAKARRTEADHVG